MTSLLDIEKRLVAAQGADRELEGDIFFLLDPDFPSGTVLHMSAAPDPATFATGAYTSVKAPAYLSSVDAALAFAERALPGWTWNVGVCPPDFLTAKDKPFGADLMGPVSWHELDRHIGEEPVYDHSSATSATAPLAICLATIRALIAQKGNTDA